MTTNLDRYSKDLDQLLDRGEKLHIAIQKECYPEQFASAAKKLGPKGKEALEGVPDFKTEYQAWFSEAKSLVRQLLPDRLADFVRHYEKPKGRKQIDFESYRIEDYLQGLAVTRGWEEKKVVGPEAAIPHFRQQIAIVASVKRRFESSLFDIRQLVQADLFDSELEAAQELARKGFARAAGALAGVVLERHLGQVVENHLIKLAKKHPSIGDLNNALREASVIEIIQWRRISHLADIRNLCDHSKGTDPTGEQIKDLIEGVGKLTKTLF